MIIFLASCTEQQADLHQIAAIVEGREITLYDVWTQYKITDENIEIYLKEETVITEAKENDIRITDEEKTKLIEQMKWFFPFEESEFFIRQAEAAGIAAEDYYEIWITNYAVRKEHIQRGIKEMFGEPASIHEADAWGKMIEDEINELYDSYIREGKLILK